MNTQTTENIKAYGLFYFLGFHTITSSRNCPSGTESWLRALSIPTWHETEISTLKQTSNTTKSYEGWMSLSHKCRLNASDERKSASDTEDAFNALRRIEHHPQKRMLKFLKHMVNHLPNWETSDISQFIQKPSHSHSPNDTEIVSLLFNSDICWNSKIPTIGIQNQGNIWCFICCFCPYLKI